MTQSKEKIYRGTFLLALMDYSSSKPNKSINFTEFMTENKGVR